MNQIMSRFPVCEPPPCSQSPSFSRPTIEAGVTNTQRSWRVSLTPTHYQTTPPPRPYLPPTKTPYHKYKYDRFLLCFVRNVVAVVVVKLVVLVQMYIYIYSDRRREREAGRIRE